MPRFFASATVSSFTMLSGSVFASTTVMTCEISTTPLSGLNFASRLRSWPKCFFAAVFIASSSVAMSTSFSMPLSLATCVMTSSRRSVACAGVMTVVSSALVGRLYVELQVGLRDVLEGNREGTGALHVDGDAVGRDAGQLAGEIFPRRVEQ